VLHKILQKFLHCFFKIELHYQTEPVNDKCQAVMLLAVFNHDK